MKLFFQKLVKWFNSVIERPRFYMEYWLDPEMDEIAIGYISALMAEFDMNIMAKNQYQVICYGHGYFVNCSTTMGSREGKDYLLLHVSGSFDSQHEIDSLLRFIEKTVAFYGKVDHKDDDYPWKELRDKADRSLVR